MTPNILDKVSGTVIGLQKLVPAHYPSFVHASDFSEMLNLTLFELSSRISGMPPTARVPSAARENEINVNMKAQ